jgi:hypothetical protein
MINKYTSVTKYEKIFDDNKEPINFNKLDKIIKLQRDRYKSGLITLEQYYKYFNNIEQFKKLCYEYWEV